MKTVGKPCAGKPHARFDEGSGSIGNIVTLTDERVRNSEHKLQPVATAPTLYSTELVRYADDFVCVVQSAEDIEKALKARFERYGLEIHPDKSRAFSFGRFEGENAMRQNRRANTFDFLGFTHYATKPAKEDLKLGARRVAFKAKCKDMNLWLKSVRNLVKTKEWWKVLRAKLHGHYQYYGVSGNMPSISKYYSITVRFVHKWLNRRSQKKRMSWSKLKNYLSCYPLPKPSIKHNLYTLSHAK